MPRLKNTLTGVTVSVDDKTAAALSAEWKPAESKPRSGAADKSTDKRSEK